MNQPELRFDGPEFNQTRDGARLTGQIGRIARLMADERWRTLSEIAEETGDPQSSVSAQLRHLRKPRFGGNTVERKHLGRGLFAYRVRKLER